MKQKRFSPLKNLMHSIHGFIEVSKNEKPMQIELMTAAILTIVLFLIDISFVSKLLLFASLVFVLLVEILNSAIERVVDLVTLEYHELAKHAKDAASAGVLLALIIVGILWIVVIGSEKGYL
jgi:diacylglycerol kinase (ATP)